MQNLNVRFKDQFRCIAPDAGLAHASTAAPSLPRSAVCSRRPVCLAVPCHPGTFRAVHRRLRYYACPCCQAGAPMTLADAWACFRAMAWLVPCLLLALAACTGASPRTGHSPASSAQRAGPQRIAHQARPTVRIARAAPPVAATPIDADEKERLFRGFVEWQGAQDAAR